MKVCALRTLVVLLVAAYPCCAWSQSPTYEDGSEADVYYYSVDDSGDIVPTAADAQPDEGAEAYEPGNVEPSATMNPGFNTYGADSTGCYDCCNSNPCCCRSCCNSCCRWWARGEYLMWWMSGDRVPPLVTTSPDNTPINEAGVLPDAEILFPTERLNGDGRAGGRVTIGYWGDACETWGVEGNFWALDKSGDGFQASSDNDGSPILARPFIDSETGLNDAFIVAYPDVFSGTITVASSSDVFGAEVNLHRNFLSNGRARLDLLAGYRFVKVRESLSVFENQTAIDPLGIIPLGTEISIQDVFAMENEFHGGQVGLVVQKQCCRWTLEGTGKVALGSWNQRANIGGFTSVAVPDEPIVVNEGGILALASNSGNFERNRFTAIPEVDLTLRYQLTRIWKLNVGYSFMYLPRIVRPGNNIDLRIDPDQLPPPTDTAAFPEFNFKESDVWLQGVSLGLEARF